MENRIIEIIFLPKGITIIFYIQLFVVSLIVFKTEGFSYDLLFIINPLTLSFGFLNLKKVFSPNQFSYIFFPIQLRKKNIMWRDIKKIKIIEVKALNDFWGWGFRHSPKYGWSYIFNDGYALVLITNKNKKRTFSLKNKEKIIAFLDTNNLPYEIN